MKKIKNYINGNLLADSSEYFPVFDPSKGEKIGEVCMSNENDFVNLKRISQKKNAKIPKRLSDFKRLFNSYNFSRLKCIFLPIDAVLKALKL